MEIPDLSPALYSRDLHRGANALSIGWLGSTVPSKGPIQPELLEALRHYSRARYHEDWELGQHVCEICGGARGHGEFSVEWAGRRYVLPMLALHYCEAHEYCPPEEFLAALSARWEVDRDAG